MAGRKRKAQTLPTIWHVPDAVWAEVEVLIDKYDPPRRTGRPRTDPRKALDGVLHRGRTGCQWNALPEVFGDDSSVHRAMQRWVQCRLFEHLWALLLSECEELGGVDWQWQSADCALGKARHGGIKSDRTQLIGRSTAPNAAS